MFIVLKAFVIRKKKKNIPVLTSHSRGLFWLRIFYLIIVFGINIFIQKLPITMVSELIWYAFSLLV